MSLPPTLVGRLRHFATTTPDRVALREKRLGIWQETTWRGYWDNVATAGHALMEIGVRPGDHVAILSDNRPEWVYADLGAQGIGARTVGIYQTNPPGDVEYALSHSGSVVLFCEDQEQVDKAVEIADQTPAVRHVIAFDPRGTRGYDDPRLISWEDFLTRGQAAAEREPDGFGRSVDELDPDAPAMLVYTSGTTGHPKGAMLSSRNATATATAMAPLFGITRDDTLLSYLPLCHVAEKIFSLFLPLSVGAVVHFGESIDTVREDLREVSPTIFLGVPRIWEKMHASLTLKMQDSSWLKRTLFDVFARLGQGIARRRERGTSRWFDRITWFVGDLVVYRPLQERLGLRRCWLACSGAAPISPHLLRWFHGVGVPMVEGFGQTEDAGVTHVNMPTANRVGTVGRPLPGVEQRLAEDGELWVRSPGVFLGYYRDEEATAETVDSEGWLHTGDVGEIDTDGYLRITGRKKEIIITAGGKNLSPEKIENALKVSPYIKEVVSVGDRRKFVAALVQIEPDTVGNWAARKGITYTSFADLASKPQVHTLIEAEIRTANERLARVEQVRSFRLLPKELHQDDGEMTATQKVRRKAVLETWADLVEDNYRG